MPEKVPQPSSKIVKWQASHIFLADDAKKEFQKFIRDGARENKALFRNYNINSHNLDEFYMEYLKDSIQYKSFTLVLKFALTLFRGKADVECGFSLNNKLIFENISGESLIAQRFLKDHMLLNDYNPMICPFLRN